MHVHACVYVWLNRMDAGLVERIAYDLPTLSPPVHLDLKAQFQWPYSAQEQAIWEAIENSGLPEKYYKKCSTHMAKAPIILLAT